MRYDMKEIGGYIELDTYQLPMLHGEAIGLNSGRNCLVYLIKSKKIKKILLPRYLCESVRDVCIRENVQIRYYSVGVDFLPKEVALVEDEWLYIVNYYGQLNNSVLNNMVKKYKKVIVDNTQAYFQEPLEGVDTLYTCRKFYGVPDGAFLYTDGRLQVELEKDESFEKMRYLLGRYERNASEFYNEYTENEAVFSEEPIKCMSKLTFNLLHGIDYEMVMHKRTNNFAVLHNIFDSINKLRLSIPKGAFMYPLFVSNGEKIRKQLQAKKIYIPTLWPEVLEHCEETEIEHNMVKNILPLPVDQRYGIEDMQYMADEIKKYLKN